MRLAADRFYKSDLTVTRTDGRREAVPCYSYETKTDLYDIAVVDGHKYYRVNCGPWATTIDRITRIHADIEAHFGI